MFFGQLTGVWEITDTTRHSTAKEYQYLRGGLQWGNIKGPCLHGTTRQFPNNSQS